MTILVLFILGVAWAVALVPPWLRRRREDRPNDSILSFHHQLSTLQRTTPAGRVPSGPLRPQAMARRAVRRRRRDVLFTLVATTGLTALVAVVVQGVAVVAFLVTAVALCSYASLLIQLHKRAVERKLKVRYLAPQHVQPEAALLLRRSASN